MRETSARRVGVIAVVVAFGLVAVACREPGARGPTGRATSDAGVGSDAHVANHADAALVVDAASALSEDASAAADAGPRETIAWDQYFSLKEQAYDVVRAHEATYEKMSSTPRTSRDDDVVLCRVAVVEPAPLPSSAWDRANGRDLLLEVDVGGTQVARVEGPLGQIALHLRAERLLGPSATGAPVTWTVRDRDQNRAYPYTTSIEVGRFVVPPDVKVPFHVKPTALDVECRGAPKAEAARALLPEADRALADAERDATWKDGDPRGEHALRDALSSAADRIRIGEVIARSVSDVTEWSAREERLRAIVRRYLAAASDAWDKLAPAPAGRWVRVGPTMTARVGAWVCPPVPKGADPGSLNDEQRVGCGLAVELRSPTKLAFDANPWGDAYACRRTGTIDVASLDGPGKANGVCVLGVRRGARWLKHAVELGPTEPVVLVLGGPVTRVIRVSVGEQFADLETPPPPPAPGAP